MSPLALSLRFLQTQPDGRLVELSRAGHERAFEALVQRYRRQLLAYCRRITASEASAEDALQQALLQAWVALSTSEVEVRDARAWLYRIVHNVAISNLRRTQPDAVEVDDAQRVSGADHEVERRLAVREALAGLASLPELQRRVMLSTALEGRSHDEIATALGLSHGAVRGLIYRARAALRAAAAAVTPAPLVHWAVRQQTPGAGRSAGLVETIAAGGGGVGLGGVLLKGGAVVVSVGAIAAAGITATRSRHREHHGVVAAARHSGSSANGAAHAAPVGATTAVTASAIRLVSTSAGASHGRGRDGSGHAHGAGSRSGHNGSSGSSSGHGGQGVLFGGTSHNHSGGSGSSGGDGHGSGSGHDGGGGHSSGGGDAGHSSGSSGGSGGDQHSGHDGSGTGSATFGDGGSGGDGGGGGGGTLSSATTVTSTSGGTGDGRVGGSGGDGGGDQTGGTTTGSTTTVTTTSTTTSGSATSGN